ATQAGDIARQIGELTRSAQMNNLANPDEAHLQQAARQAMTDVANNAMPRAANQIATAQPNAQANPQQAKQDLGIASGQQSDILRRLADVEQNLQPGNDLDRLAKRASRLATEQHSLQARANEILPKTLGKSMQELTPSQRDALSRLSSEQQS